MIESRYTFRQISSEKNKTGKKQQKKNSKFITGLNSVGKP